MFKSTIKKYVAITLTVFVFFVVPLTIHAAGIPSTLSYTGLLTDTGGNPLGGGGTTYYFKFSLWDDPTPGAGNKVWPTSSPQTTTLTVKQGSFSVLIGDTSNGYPDTLDYDFNSNNPVYLQVEVSSDDITYETLAPRSALSSNAFSQIAGAVHGTNDSSFGTTTSFANTLVSMLSTAIDKAVLTIKGAAGQVANLFNILDSSDNSLFTVTASGNVGVGTSTPSTRLTVGSGQISVSGGTNSLPGYTFNEDVGLDTGLYRSGEDTIGFTAGGTDRLSISSSGITSTVNLYGVNGSASSPAFTFSSDVNTGMYNISADVLGFSTGGTERFRVYNGAIESAGQVRGAAGSASVPSLTFSNDTNTGIFSLGSDSFGFSTGGTERLRFDSSGNVGIGTSGPSKKLHIYGTNNALRLTYPSVADWDMAVDSGGTFGFSPNNGANSLSITSGGNVGIGTTTPSKKLDIYTTTAGDGVRAGIAQMGNWSGSAAYAFFGYSGLADTAYALIQSNTGATMFNSASGQILRFNIGNTAAMTIASTLNVGIGTTTPTSILTIGSGQINTPLGLVTAPSYSFNGDLDTGLWSPSANIVGLAAGSNDVFRIDNTASSKILGSAPQLTLESLSGNAVNAGTLVYRTPGGSESFTSTFNASDNNFYFKYGATTIGSLTSTGWGFGITAFDPSATVHIISTTEQFRSGYDASNYWNAITDSSGLITFDAVGTGAKFSFSDNVGIGTTTPGQKLTVVGNAQFTAVTSGTYASDLNLTSDGTLTTAASDERLKKSIISLNASSTLEKLIGLRPVEFDWKSNNSHDIGLIAQEVEQIFPELVFTNPTDGFKGINYSRIPVLLISAVQEITQTIIGFSHEFRTEKLCVGDTCITEGQLKILLENQNIQAGSPQPISDTENSSTSTDSNNNENSSSEGDIQNSTDNTESNEEPVSNTESNSETSITSSGQDSQTGTSQSEVSSDSSGETSSGATE